MKTRKILQLCSLSLAIIAITAGAFFFTFKQTEAIVPVTPPITQQVVLQIQAPTVTPVLIPPNTQIVKHLFNIKNIPSPKAVTISKDGQEIWVTSLLNKNLGAAVFDIKDGKRLADVTLNNGGGVEVIFSHDGSKAYVSQMETAKVYEIDVKTKKVLRSFNTKSSWTKILFLNADGKRLYAANWLGNNVSEFDLETGKLVRNIPTVKTPRGIYVTSDNLYMYVAGYEYGEIQKIDLATGKGKALYKSGGAMRHMVVDDEKKIMYLSDMGRASILKLDLTTDIITKFATTDTHPNTIALTPDKKILAVSNRGKNFSATDYYRPGPEWGSVQLFDTTDGKLLDAIVGGNQPTALDISPDGTKLIFSDFLDARLQVWELPSYEVLKSGNGGLGNVYKTQLKKKK